MNISEFTVPGFKGPFFPGIQVSQPHIVDNHIFHQGVPELMGTVPVDAYLDVDIGLFFDLLDPFVARDVVLLEQIQAVQFLDRQQVDQVLKIC